MNTPWSIIKEIEADNSRLAKEEILKREALEENTEFFEGCKLALNSMVTFGVKQITPKTGDGRGLSWEGFKKVADALATRQLTGNAAITAVNHARLSATEAQWNDWYRRILIKDLRCGVSEKTINKVVSKINKDYTIPVFTCQLAHNSEDHESKVCGKKLIEVKLDGVRVITIVYPSGHVEQFSRNGKELTNFETIKKQISKHALFFREPMVLDGEVMSSSFQDLMKQVYRKRDVETDDAVLHLFDIVTLKEFNQGISEFNQVNRSRSLLSWYSPCADHMPNVSVVGQEMVDLDTEEGYERYLEINYNAVAGGYEGIMIKDPSAVYKCKRSVAWLKLKPFIEVTLEIKECEEGTGKNVGRLGALVCSGVDDGRTINVNVGGGYTDSMRDDFWSNRTGIIGALVEVRADGITQNQDGSYSLRFPRFKTFRGFDNGEKI